MGYVYLHIGITAHTVGELVGHALEKSSVDRHLTFKILKRKKVNIEIQASPGGHSPRQISEAPPQGTQLVAGRLDTTSGRSEEYL